MNQTHPLWFFKMRVSSKIFPITVFILVFGTSVGLLIFPKFLYTLLLWFIKAFQAGGLPILFVAMIIQALAIPIPSEFILICGGAAFGLLPAWIIGAFGSIVAAFVGFYISRKGGRSIALRFVSTRGISFADTWFNRWGVWAVFLGRLAPFIPFDAISYSAGLTKMRFRSFLFPTIIGTLPRALFYVFIGDSFSVTITELIEYYPSVPPELQEKIFLFNEILFAIVIIMAAMLVGYWFVLRRYSKTENKSI